jgi:histidinol dehydrogenase
VALKILPCRGPFMRTLTSTDANFDSQLSELLAFETVNDKDLLTTVDDIIDQVRSTGDAAVLSLTQQFDQHPATSMAELELTQEALAEAFAGLDAEGKEALTTAATRVQDFHQRQVQETWQYNDELGNRLGQKVTPLDRVGIYVPGGLASYPSSVLMNAIPAKVAGVPEVIMVVPAPKGELNPLVLAAAHLAKVDRVFTIGGAQAVAALAYGTETIPQVDKVTGPGNKYVAAAKRAVFGQVGIDMIAGPSEVLVYAEGEAGDRADWLAMDLLSQAEHDTVAQAIFVTTSQSQLDAVAIEIEKALAELPKADIARAALQNRGALILVKDRAEGISVINRVAPEHLELSLDDPDSVINDIRHAGAIFMGRHTPEAIGDYCAGPNHVLPTSGTARFSSPLGVYDFQKKTSLIYCSESGSKPLAQTADILAQREDLEAHARSARYRS